MYQEHYYPNLDDAQREENRLHSEHCLNHLRKSAMCHGDVGIITYRWGNDSRRPYAAATKHQCVKWDALAEWTNERTIDMFKPGYLVHPTLGECEPLFRARNGTETLTFRDRTGIQGGRGKGSYGLRLDEGFLFYLVAKT
jgi:hypothetical protein